MLSVMVCHSYFLHLDSKQSERCKPYPPLATIQVVALLRRAGYAVSFFDAMLADGTAVFEAQLRAVRPEVVVIYEDTFNFLSKMCLAAMRSAACDMIAMARRSGARVIVAGPDVTDAPLPYLLAGADYSLVGEGLAALMALLSRLGARAQARTELPDDVPGVRILGHGRMIDLTGPPPGPTDYDGTAAWDVVDIPRYRRTWNDAHGYFSLNLAASRGCSFRCAWCAKPTWGNQYLQREPEDVATEMALVKRLFDPDHIWFADDIFGFRADWVSRFADALTRLGGRIPFTIQTRADLASGPMIRALKSAGCTEVWLGAESGSQRVLDAMNKGTRVGDIIRACADFKLAGIRVGFFIQLGYLGEQLADLLATRELISTTRPDQIGVSVSYPLPGTRFHEIVKSQLGEKTRWDESSDLAMMFHGTYTSDFYRAVRQLLHDQVELQSGRDDGTVMKAATPVTIASQGLALERRWQTLLSEEATYRSPVRLLPTASLQATA